MTYQLKDLLYLMARLRHPEQGCPWDLAQDFHSIVPHTLEEAYEVADAIERNDMAQLPSELGDLLFQVVYYSQMGAEEGWFDFHQVLNTLMEKMIRRHPHVFPNGDLYATSTEKPSQAALKQQWEAIKATEGQPQSSSPLGDIPLNLPALARAAKLQKKASRLGFDWPELAPVMEKLEEEVAELKEALQGSPEEIRHELGDVLFSVVNLARHLQLDAEQVLRQANHRFERRFQRVAEKVTASGRTIKETSPEQLDLFWEAAKAELASEDT